MYIYIYLHPSLLCLSAYGCSPPPFRLLQVSPEEARRVICAPKEVVEEFQEEASNVLKVLKVLKP